MTAALRVVREPARSRLPPPGFLHPHQHDAWRRTISALEVWRGALLLEAVGTGKTWIALAVAAVEARPAVAVVPAILQAQWRDAARRAGIVLRLWTHERTSRGGTPDCPASLVIVDEAHRFRVHGTRRVQTLAPWLVGRRVLLLTATPIVNRLGDLVALLRLALPEDALALDGVPTLGSLDEMDTPPDALRRVAIRSQALTAGPIHRRVVHWPPDAVENRRGSAAVAKVGNLALSSCAAIHRLLTSVLIDAAASSDAAFYAALKRYRALLLQSRDAGGASRAMLRRFAGDGLEQLVLWPLFELDPSTNDLPLADIPRIDAILMDAPNDAAWIAALAARCDDERPTVCFSRHRATARLLREALGETTAWVTGSDAGMGPHRIAREAILTAFGPGRRSWRVRRSPPRVLVATDVAAEGLDLHAAGRIVHVDLPWTATRLEQREGRLVRLGQEHAHVEVIVRVPAAAIERVLTPAARVRRKHRLAEVWLRAIESDEDTTGDQSADPRVAPVEASGEPIMLVAVRLERDQRSGSMVMLRCGTGPWQMDGGLARTVLRRSRIARPTEMNPGVTAAQLAGAMRAAIAASSSPGSNPPPGLVARIHRLARVAAARRDDGAMQRLDRLLRFLTASPTLGARLLNTRLAECDDDEFVAADVPDVPTTGAVGATVIAAVLCNQPRS